MIMMKAISRTEGSVSIAESWSRGEAQPIKGKSGLGETNWSQGSLSLSRNSIRAKLNMQLLILHANISRPVVSDVQPYPIYRLAAIPCIFTTKTLTLQR